MEITYKISGGVGRETIEEEITRAWRDLQSDERLRQQLASKGVDVAAAADVQPRQAIEVRSPESGFVGEVVIIGLAVKIAGDIWEKLILPRLQKRFGADALVERKRDS